MNSGNFPSVYQLTVVKVCRVTTANDSEFHYLLTLLIFLDSQFSFCSIPYMLFIILTILGQKKTMANCSEIVWGLMVIFPEFFTQSWVTNSLRCRLIVIRPPKHPLHVIRACLVKTCLVRTFTSMEYNSVTKYTI